MSFIRLYTGLLILVTVMITVYLAGGIVSLSGSVREYSEYNNQIDRSRTLLSKIDVENIVPDESELVRIKIKKEEILEVIHDAEKNYELVTTRIDPMERPNDNISVLPVEFSGSYKGMMKFIYHLEKKYINLRVGYTKFYSEENFNQNNEQLKSKIYIEHISF
ncbi:hypothetical protein [Mangrovivirga cuniculi]|uniref:Uncharacterized protein n=1 Tax=Mangrovivirga cuniculi TaxID=2715131 RepID=A0A4D7JJZ0_9BACT|nr:hypothetical protein [Mangrovivirga cuniculi]QCK13770.1 hypothetical protein DCC35_02855 [Mangrovivirga cuniculi]